MRAMILAVMSCTCLLSPAANEKENEIKVGETQFHITPPAEWQIQKADDGGMTFVSPDGSAAIHLFGETIAADNNLIDQLMADTQQPMMNDGWKQVSKSTTETEVHLRREMEFSRKLDGQDARHRLIVEVRDGHLVVINAMYHPGIAVDAEAVKNTVASVRHASAMVNDNAPITPATAETTGEDVRKYHWFTEQRTNLAWQVPSSWEIQKIDGRIYITPDQGDPLHDSGGIRIQILDRKSEEYRDNQAAVGQLLKFASAHQAKIIDHQVRRLGSLDCQLHEIRITLENVPHHMRFIHVERENSICVIQYDVEGDPGEIEKLSGFMKPAFLAATSSLREGDGQ